MPLDNLRILLIDDEPKLIDDMLRAYGFDVTIATDGLSGIRMLDEARESFDLVILDVNMPVMDGWAVLKTIRNNQGQDNLPIMMLTGVDDEDALITGLRRGADEYLTKPITPKRLLAHIQAISRRFTTTIASAVQDNGDEEMMKIFKSLTVREQELLKYLTQGLSNQEIGEYLGISQLTVKNHLAHIYKKLNVSNRTQAAFLVQKLTGQ